MNQKIALITGASSGIGREFVRLLDRHSKTFDEVWVIARRTQRLEQLQKEMSQFQLRIISLDLCKQEHLDKLEKLLHEEHPRIRLFINSAGIGKEKRFEQLKREDIQDMTLLNVYAFTMLTHIVLPFMAKPSNIIQMSSASAFLPQKDFSVYAATKSYILNYSLSLYSELREKEIYVTTVCPGPVDTEFLKISNDGNPQKPLKKLVTVSPTSVAYKALVDSKKRKILSIYGLPMKIVQLFSRTVSYSLYLK